MNKLEKVMLHWKDTKKDNKKLNKILKIKTKL